MIVKNNVNENYLMINNRITNEIFKIEKILFVKKMLKSKFSKKFKLLIKSIVKLFHFLIN